jgi:pSer/pThr/pTyr-binding forkhead associated (FHA) protein
VDITPLSPPLFVDYAGRRYHVASMRFVIGRDQKTCHLVLPDSNVSRNHAVVEWINGVYWLVDQGSTNGVGCNGHRIHRKQIVEGDRFEISGHTIVFTYRVRG